VPLHQGSNIKLRLLDNLNLADVTVLNWEDTGHLALNLLSSGSSNEGLDKCLKVTLSRKCSHGVDHLGTDGTDLGRLGVTGLLELIILLLGEGDAEQSDNVSVRGTRINICLKNRLLLLDQGAKLVACHVHTVEVKKAVKSLNVLDAKLYLAVAHGLVVVQVSEGDLDDTSLKSIGSNFCSLGLCDDGLSALLLGEDGWSNELVPFFLEERVNCLFLSALLGLRKPLVLSL